MSSKSTTRSRTRWRGFIEENTCNQQILEQIRPCQLEMVGMERTRGLRMSTTESPSSASSGAGVCVFSVAHERESRPKPRTPLSHYIKTPTNTTMGWRFVTESSWTLWHPRGSQQGHPRYNGAVITEGRWWLDNKSRHVRTTIQQDTHKTKVTVTRFGNKLRAKPGLIKDSSTGVCSTGKRGTLNSRCDGVSVVFFFFLKTSFLGTRTLTI